MPQHDRHVGFGLIASSSRRVATYCATFQPVNTLTRLVDMSKMESLRFHPNRIVMLGFHVIFSASPRQLNKHHRRR